MLYKSLATTALVISFFSLIRLPVEAAHWTEPDLAALRTFFQKPAVKESEDIMKYGAHINYGASLDDALKGHQYVDGYVQILMGHCARKVITADCQAALDALRATVLSSRGLQ